MAVQTPTEQLAVLTVPEVASLLRIGRRQAYEAVRRGDLPSVQVGRSVRVPRAALERLLAGEPTAERAG